VLAHHERLNGTGYPRGLRDGQIPLEAKILSVADIFCALTEHRVYQPALLDARQAMAIIEPMAGRELDEQTVEILKSLVLEPDLATPPDPNRTTGNVRGSRCESVTGDASSEADTVSATAQVASQAPL